MAACKSLHHIFDKPLPESSPLLDSLSWNQIKSIEQSSFTELFGELHFKDNSPSDTKQRPQKANFSPRNIGSLQLCTEGLGFESFDYVEDLKSDINEEKKENRDERTSVKLRAVNEGKKLKSGGFPPPIPSIGKSGKPSVAFKSYREDGRFVLKRVKMESREFLRAHREHGRLQLHFVHPSDEHEGDENEEKYTQDDQEEALLQQ